ncbi:isopeptide-forming domain-containing fimbrial protein [Shouchella lonarensis]|uniref:LPXTG-motif cell wall anchor domain-containing protein/fimbrial isopeptide formation D2 domain-containing protein n=1 Tax=Shouchella lonarensis TaxID=1464122 RepID=A0A1G6HCY4_9BACI|nr:isopeptide-forming domain-containing fimbrial protein [Shouchella lonarensis]SDB91948.1 LPXTG-motif cell wall anchor domain-containing protein/fimbrial isopeptide formation D2 domain-containing protein [Shouchella lonarensis]
MKLKLGNLLPFVLLFLLSFQLFFQPGQTFALNTNNGLTHTSTELNTDDPCVKPYELTASFMKEKERVPIDLVFVQDASGSFRHTIDTVKSTLNEVIDLLYPESRVQLTTFRGAKGNKTADGNVQEIDWSYNVHTAQPLTSDFAQAKAAVNAFEIGSATPTASGLKEALESYESNKGDIQDRQTVFVLITDGVANTRLDGYLHQRDNNFTMRTPKGQMSVEYNQDYKTATAEAVAQANEIKAKGYGMITAYWEDFDLFTQPGQMEDRYNGELVNPERDSEDYPARPYVMAALQNMASTPTDFIEASTKDGDRISDFTDKLKKLIATKQQMHATFTVDERYDIDEDSVKLMASDGTTITPEINGNEITFDLADVPVGQYEITYKITQKSLIKESHTASTGTLFIEGKEMAFPIVTHDANDASCWDVPPPPVTPDPPTITKNINDTDHLLIDREMEFLYTVVTTIPEDIATYESFTITDNVDAGLKVNEGAVKVEVDGEEYEGLKLAVEGNLITVAVTDFAGLEGKKEITLFIPAMIDADTDLRQYEDEKIPNMATVSFKNGSGEEGKADSPVVTVTSQTKEQPKEPGEEKDPPKDPGKDPEPPKAGPEKPGSVLLPQTGEAFLWYLMVIGLIFAAAGGYLLFKKKKKVLND